MAGYSDTPLVKKLGIKTGYRIYLHRSPSDYFKWIDPLPDRLDISGRLSGRFDFIHLFVTEEKDFRALFLKARGKLKNDGMVWVSWPKRSSGVMSDLDENIIRNFGLKEGMVDVKVCAVDEVWSGLKFVIPVRDRK